MATPESERSRRASLTRSPDTLSPVWPDRLIRPLPRNRLRSKLSPEQAETITYPSAPQQSSPLFHYPYGSEHHEVITRAQTNGHRRESSTQCDCGRNHADHSDEEEGPYDHPTYRWTSPGPMMHNMQQRYATGSRNGAGQPPAPASIASSADGYDSFENTSNKKKRKIPISSSSNMQQASLTAELANMGISSPLGEAETAEVVNNALTSYYSNHGTGISGAGRGRYGRSSGKVERRGNKNGVLDNAYTSSLASNRGGDYTGDGVKIDKGDQGIISTAIANAAGQGSTASTKGKENVSLLSQQPNKSPTKSQFTFTCETDSSNPIVWPIQGSAPYDQQKKNYYQTRHHGETANGNNQGMPTTAGARQPDPRMAAPPPPPQASQAPVNGQLPPQRPRRRRPSKEFAMAARQRKLAQEFTNYQHKPTKESMWICEFCEYEDIYGTPPLALLRQYEVKDKAERHRADERRRLLEKAKMKKNKGKNRGKGGKNAHNPPPNAGQGYDPAMDNANMPPDIAGDEYYEDEYDDGYSQDPNGHGPMYADEYEEYPPGAPMHHFDHNHAVPPAAPAA